MNPTDQLVLEGLKIGIPAFVTLGVLFLTNWAFSQRQKVDHRRDQLKLLDDKKEKLVEALLAYSKGYSNYVVEIENYFGGVGTRDELNSRIVPGIEGQQAAEQTIEMLIRLYFPEQLGEWKELVSFKKTSNASIRTMLVSEVPKLPKEKRATILAFGEEYASRTRGLIQAMIAQPSARKR